MLYHCWFLLFWSVNRRLDYFVISKRLQKDLCDSIIQQKVMGSDHCPIMLLMAGLKWGAPQGHQEGKLSHIRMIKNTWSGFLDGNIASVLQSVTLCNVMIFLDILCCKWLIHLGNP